MFTINNGFHYDNDVLNLHLGVANPFISCNIKQCWQADRREESVILWGKSSHRYLLGLHTKTIACHYEFTHNI